MSDKTWDAIVKRLPGLLSALMESKPHTLQVLTKGKMQQLLEERGCRAGVYVLSRTADDQAAYVGRCLSLPQRAGSDHRSLDRICNPVALRLKKKFAFPRMSDARDYLYENYQIRLAVEPDANTRAVFELYAALRLKTEFNSFEEHGPA